MRWGCLSLSVLSWGILTGFAPQVRAQPGGVVVEWSASSECERQVPLAAEIERLLGRPLSEAPAIRVRAAVHRREPALRLELHMERDEGGSTRTLDGPSCDALVRAGALIIAVAIDPNAVAEQPTSEAEVGEPPFEPPPSEAQPAGGAPQPPTLAASLGADPAAEEVSRLAAGTPAPIGAPRRPDPPDDAADDASDEPDVRFIASLTPALSIGPLPAPAPALGLSVGVGIGPVEITLAGLATADQGAELVDSGEAGGRLGLALGRLRGCASIHPVGDWLELLPCLAIEAGALWGHGVNVPIVRSGAAPWVAAATALEARFWIVDALALGLSADLLFPILRPRFVLTLEGEPHELHRPYDVGGLFGLTVTLRLR